MKTGGAWSLGKEHPERGVAAGSTPAKHRETYPAHFLHTRYNWQEDGKIELKEYEANAKGIIQSYVDREYV